MRAAETIVWAAGEHDFRLDIGALRAIEQRCDAGVSVTLLRLLGQQWKADDVLSVIRLGLVGGGMDGDNARKLVDKALETASLFALSVTAADVLRRFVMFDGDDQPGEADAGTANSPTRSPTAEPDGPATSEPERS